MYVFELHLGKNSLRIANRIVTHLNLMISRKAHKQFNYPTKRAYYLLSLFGEKSAIDSLIRRIEKERARFNNVHHLVLCRTVNSIQGSPINEEWTSILRTQCSLTIKN